MTDISDTLKADSTQLNAIDFTGGPRTYTVSSVRVVSGDQPVNIRLAEDVDGREYRPSKSMRRVLAACWGPDSDAWVGRRLTLYCDPSVKWGGKPVGGIKISAASHLEKTKTVAIQESSTVRSQHKVEPLPDAPAAPAPPPEPTAEQVAACTELGVLRRMWDAAISDDRKAQIQAKRAELEGAQQPADEPEQGAER